MRALPAIVAGGLLVLLALPPGGLGGGARSGRPRRQLGVVRALGESV